MPIPMFEYPLAYPPDDDIAYFDWYGEQFSSIFVALNPFIRAPIDPTPQTGGWLDRAILLEAKKQGEESGVSWHEIAASCGFVSVRQVNRALRLTGSKRIGPNLASSSDTARLSRVCAESNILLPDEGRLSPALQISVGRFLSALRLTFVQVASHFGAGPRRVEVADFLEPSIIVRGGEIAATDQSVYIAIYTDYHHALICQTDGSRRLANPAEYFEGFEADEKTNDLWGVGSLDGAPPVEWLTP